MKVQNHGLISDGIDFTPELLSPKLKTNWDNVAFTFDTGKTAQWAAVIKNQYKLVVSSFEIPWLFDLNEDPFEIINYFDDPNYQEISTELLDHLFWTIRTQDIPLKYASSQMYWSKPDCFDSKDRIQFFDKAVTFADLEKNSIECTNRPLVRELCPITCGTCCKNSVAKPLWHRGTLKYCSDLKQFCNSLKVQTLCPTTCKEQTGCSA